MPRCLPSPVILGAFLRASHAALCNNYNLQECDGVIALNCYCAWDNETNMCERSNRCNIGPGAITEDGVGPCPDLNYLWDAGLRDECCQMNHCAEFLSSASCFTRELWQINKEVACRCCSDPFQQGYADGEGLYSRAMYAPPPDDVEDENTTVATTTTSVWCLPLERVWTDEDRESCCQDVSAYCSAFPGDSVCMSQPDWTESREISCRCCAAGGSWTQGYVVPGGEWRAAVAASDATVVTTSSAATNETTTEAVPLSQAALRRSWSVVVGLMVAISGPI